jgi:hypothetical protein
LALDLKISETLFITLMGATFPFIVYDRRRPALQRREHVPVWGCGLPEGWSTQPTR